jgi:hypothetical protein
MISVVFIVINWILEWISIIVFVLLLLIGGAGVIAHFTLMEADIVLHSNDIDYSKVDMIRYLGN